ncbi:BTAD domain-containing putative transcriptional regulator [Polymorphospora rubra]|uniref:Bacterial transcriptional activator domain-containing protein n=1 Tax=Polymorphospora rubra TaxID=338584 RepID=A0A810MPI5_9ACTN|nr:BTAD domain-containing putative transcriptional regulator [Polymorphospora rubra]BCJ63001.1 hypothetical protein Prubr_00220 [Polymorphospora rubra]
MPGAFAVIARTVRAVLALTALAGFTAGVPWLLIVAAGWPLDWIGWHQPSAIPSADDLYTAVTSPWSDHMLLALLATIGWVLWAQFLRDTTIEIIEAFAARGGPPRPPARRRGPIRWVAAALVGAIAGAVLFDAARAITHTPGTAVADAAARNPAVTVAPARPDTPTTAHHGPRPVLTIDMSATTPTISTTAPSATHRDGGAVPSWVRDAPGGTHRVVAGDNLWDLAATHLGDPHRWREIYTLNRGHEQANGYALTDPDEIHVGWILALPTRDTAAGPNAAGSGSPDTSAPPANEPGPAVPPPTTAAPAPGTPEPPVPEPDTAEPGAPGDPADTSTPAPDTEPRQDEQDDEAGIALSAQGWISLGLAAAIAAVATLLRLQHRRRARLTFPPPASIAPHPAPIPPPLTRIDTIGNRQGPSTEDHHPTGPTPPAPIGIDTDAAEVSLFHLPGPGIALHGDGAIPAARATLAAVLTTNATETAVLRPVVVTTANLLAQLLPQGAPAVGLDPDGTAYDGERLLVLADTAAAITHAEEEMITRRRLLDTFNAETITDLNTRDDHAETQPPYVLLIEATSRHASRLNAVTAHRAALDLHPIILGPHDGIPAIEVTADGTVTSDEPHPVARWSTLSADDLAAVLTMLTDSLARPEAGTDVDDPPVETSPASVTTEATEPVPAQPDDADALVRLRVLGPATVTTDTGPIATGMRSGSYATLALLAAHPTGRTLDQLATDLHPTVDPAAAVKRVRTDITSARRVLRTATGHDEPMFIVYDPATGRYQLDPQTVTVDLWQMLTALDQATSSDDEATMLAALRRAAELYTGDFAEGHDHTWATDYASGYRHQILTAYARIAEILEADHSDQAIAVLERATDLEPVNEELYQRIMRIHGRQQRPDAVRRTLRRLEERLADLDTEPSQATRRIAERQLRPVTQVSGTRS